MSLDDARDERRKLLPELIASAQEVSGITRRTNEGVVTGLRLRFDYRAGLLSMLTRLADTEHAACTMLKIGFSLQPNGGPINVEMTGPEGTREMLLNFGQAS
jgi:hypothetical protein